MTEKPKGTLNFSLRGQKKIESKITDCVNGCLKLNYFFFVLLVKPESWTIFKSYTSDIDPILGNHPFPIISLLGRISIERLNKGIYDKEPIGTQLKKNHTAQSAGKRKWQVAIYSFESDW